MTARDLTIWAHRCSCGGRGIIHLSAEHHEPVSPADVAPFAGRACPLCSDYVTGPCPECAAGAIAAVVRARAECDRIEAAVRTNPTAPDFDGAYLAALKHIRAALTGEETT